MGAPALMSKSLIKLGHVDMGPNRAELAGAVGVYGHKAAQFGFRQFVRQIWESEMKKRCSGVNPSIACVCRVLRRAPVAWLRRQCWCRQVRDIFAQREFAVHVQARQRLVGIVLVHTF